MTMRRRPAPDPQTELSFIEHLEELRNRIIRMALYWFAGTGVGWYIKQPLLNVLRRPAERGAALVGIAHLPFRQFEPVGSLILALNIAAVAGLVIASPGILAELWGFLRPALRPAERRWFAAMIPAAFGFLLGGILFAYWVAQYVFQYVFYLNGTMGVQAELTLNTYLSFMLKLLLGTGLSFELPMVLLFLAYAGVIKSEWLVARWRYIVIAIIILTAIFSPTNDPLTMSFFAIPLLLLFFLSIWLVKMMERRRAKEAAEEAAREAEERAAGPQLRLAEATVPTEPGSVQAEEADAFSYYERMAQAFPEPEPEAQPPDEEAPPGGEPS
jgi:sec-independent protein translocase protein TatC